MKRKSDSLIGELTFRTNDGKRAVVQVYRGKGTFKLRRVMSDGTLDEKVNVDVYKGSGDRREVPYFLKPNTTPSPPAAAFSTCGAPTATARDTSAHSPQ